MKATRLAVPAVLLALAACGGSDGGSSPTDPGFAPPAQVEAQSFQLVNRARADEGLPPLAQDPRLGEIARTYSAAMRDRDFFSHVDPEGNDFVDRLRQGGVVFTAAGENLALVTNSGDPAGFAHEGFLRNPEHRRNILDGNLTHAGVGVAREGGTYWITQLFVRR